MVWMTVACLKPCLGLHSTHRSEKESRTRSSCCVSPFISKRLHSFRSAMRMLRPVKSNVCMYVCRNCPAARPPSSSTVESCVVDSVDVLVEADSREGRTVGADAGGGDGLPPNRRRRNDRFLWSVGGAEFTTEGSWRVTAMLGADGCLLVFMLLKDINRLSMLTVVMVLAVVGEHAVVLFGGVRRCGS